VIAFSDEATFLGLLAGRVSPLGAARSGGLRSLRGSLNASLSGKLVFAFRQLREQGPLPQGIAEAAAAAAAATATGRGVAQQGAAGPNPAESWPGQYYPPGGGGASGGGSQSRPPASVSDRARSTSAPRSGGRHGEGLRSRLGAGGGGGRSSAESRLLALAHAARAAGRGGGGSSVAAVIEVSLPVDGVRDGGGGSLGGGKAGAGLGSGGKGVTTFAVTGRARAVLLF